MSVNVPPEVILGTLRDNAPFFALLLLLVVLGTAVAFYFWRSVIMHAVETRNVIVSRERPRHALDPSLLIPLAVGGCAGLATPVVAITLVSIGVFRCFDTAAVLSFSSLIPGSVGVGLVAMAGVLVGSSRRAVGLLTLAAGIALVGLALAGPPYHDCEAFIPRR